VSEGLDETREGDPVPVRRAKPGELRKPVAVGLAERFSLEEEFRARIADATKLKGDELAKLVGDLEVLCGSYQDHTSEATKEAATTVAKWYRDVVKTWDKLIALLKRRPEGAVVGGPSIRQLGICRLQARADENLYKVRARKKRRPRGGKTRSWTSREWVGRSRGADLACRNWLAQEARRAVERHCGHLEPTDLRRVVVAVLEAAGATFSSPEANPTKFDDMMAPFDDPRKKTARKKRSGEA
jgi:hypothetical protein